MHGKFLWAWAGPSSKIARHVNLHSSRMRQQKIRVDIRDEIYVCVTLVSRLARIDHHFFLDFIFQ